MGVRESLLNTITSVADSDFVRIVTSAGASSKATVRNLFKGFESSLSAKSSLTTSDYIRVVGSDNESYKQSMNSVKSTLGVTALETEVNALNSKNSATLPSGITGWCEYTRAGNIVAVSFVLSVPSLSAGASIATGLPKPNRSYTTGLWHTAWNETGLRLSDTGNLYVASAINANSALRCSFAYMAN